MGFIRGWEWLVILIIVLLIFGPSKIPGLARALGKSVKEFRTGVKESREDKDAASEDKSSEIKEPGKT